MAQSIGDQVLNTDFNLVAFDVNKVFGDKYPTALVTDVNRGATHKFGWGAINVDDNIANGVIITAERLQELVTRANISIDHTTVNDHVLVFVVPANRTNIAAGTPIRAEDLNLVRSKFDNILQNNTHATVDPTNASAFVANSAGYGRSRTKRSY